MSVDTADPHEISPSPFHEIVRLREWGTDRTHQLPASALRCLVGVEHDCQVRLSAPGVLPTHAQLSRDRRQWMIRALGNTPGLLQDGARCDAFSLQPGVEIGVGGATLIAESPHWLALRSFCVRILGFASDQVPTVDRALRAIRMSLAHRVPLLLCGDFDLVPLAHALHRRVLGDGRPFVVCDPHRRNTKASVRVATNYEAGLVAVKMAIGGSLCVRKERLPKDFPSVLAEVAMGGPVQLIVCSNHLDRNTFLATSIQVPSLQARKEELPRIVDAYALDAANALHVPPTSFTKEDRAWVLRNTKSLTEIEKATLRIIALTNSRNRTRAAERLGMAPVSLARWMGRHGGQGTRPGSSDDGW
jgi:Inner membrane component of T3SS, cytoplasmic domain